MFTKEARALSISSSVARLVLQPASHLLLHKLLKGTLRKPERYSHFLLPVSLCLECRCDLVHLGLQLRLEVPFHLSRSDHSIMARNEWHGRNQLAGIHTEIDGRQEIRADLSES